MLYVEVCLRDELRCSARGHRYGIMVMKKDELIERIKKKYQDKCSVEKYDSDRTDVYIIIAPYLNVEISIFEREIQEVNNVFGIVDDLLKLGESMLPKNVI